MLLTVYGTEWPILCGCAVKKLLTHSRPAEGRRLTLPEDMVG